MDAVIIAARRRGTLAPTRQLFAFRPVAGWLLAAAVLAPMGIADAQVDSTGKARSLDSLVVTGRRDAGYRAAATSVGTKTSLPLLRSVADGSLTPGPIADLGAVSGRIRLPQTVAIDPSRAVVGWLTGKPTTPVLRLVSRGK